MRTSFSANPRVSSGTDSPKRDRTRAPCWWIPLLMAGALVAGCAGKMSREESFTPQTIRFDSSDVGRLPTDFSTALTGGGGPVSWVVREDSAAPNGKRVLVQESSDDTVYRFP